MHRLAVAAAQPVSSLILARNSCTARSSTTKHAHTFSLEKKDFRTPCCRINLTSFFIRQKMKNRDYVNYRMNLPNPDPSKRRLLGPAIQREPWYSMHRPRNIIILSALLSSLLFLKPISDVFYSLKNGVRLYRAQEQFKRELDEEEKLEINKKG